jgi:hypothetical protein
MVDQIRSVSLQRFDAFIEVLGANDVQRLQDIIARMYRFSFSNGPSSGVS